MKQNKRMIAWVLVFSILLSNFGMPVFADLDMGSHTSPQATVGDVQTVVEGDNDVTYEYVKEEVSRTKEYYHWKTVTKEKEGKVPGQVDELAGYKIPAHTQTWIETKEVEERTIWKKEKVLDGYYKDVEVPQPDKKGTEWVPAKTHTRTWTTGGYYNETTRRVKRQGELKTRKNIVSYGYYKTVRTPQPDKVSSSWVPPVYRYVTKVVGGSYEYRNRLLPDGTLDRYRVWVPKKETVRETVSAGYWKETRTPQPDKVESVWVDDITYEYETYREPDYYETVTDRTWVPERTHSETIILEDGYYKDVWIPQPPKIVQEWVEPQYKDVIDRVIPAYVVEIEHVETIPEATYSSDTPVMGQYDNQSRTPVAFYRKVPGMVDGMVEYDHTFKDYSAANESDNDGYIETVVYEYKWEKVNTVSNKTPVSIKLGNGTAVQGYIQHGSTYLDNGSTMPFDAIVQAANGSYYFKGTHGTVEVSAKDFENHGKTFPAKYEDGTDATVKYWLGSYYLGDSAIPVGMTYKAANALYYRVTESGKETVTEKEFNEIGVPDFWASLTGNWLENEAKRNEAIQRLKEDLAKGTLLLNNPENVNQVKLVQYLLGTTPTGTYSDTDMHKMQDARAAVAKPSLDDAGLISLTPELFGDLEDYKLYREQYVPNQNFISMLIGFVKGFTNGIVDEFTETAVLLTKAASMVISGEDIVGKIWNVVDGAVSVVIQSVQFVMTMDVAKIAQIGVILQDIGTMMMDALSNLSTSQIGEAIGYITGILSGNAAKTVVAPAVSSFENAVGGGIISDMMRTLGKFANGASSGFTGLWNKFKQLISNTSDFFTKSGASTPSLGLMDEIGEEILKGATKLVDDIIFEGAEEASKHLRRKAYDEFATATNGLYGSAEESANTFVRILKDEDPWPIGFDKNAAKTTLKPGQRFEMAISPGQATDMPGGFGTFDEIMDVDYVRNQLAVKAEWKPNIDRVVVYEVVDELPVISGTVGPQIDEALGKFLSGGGHQVQMLVSPADRMKYLKVIEVKDIN